MMPVNVTSFDATTKDGLIELQGDLLQAAFDRKLGSNDLAAMNASVHNLIQLVAPTPAVTVCVHNAIDLSQAREYARKLPKDKQVDLAEAIAQLEHSCPGPGA